jgi:TRAP-type C4-dicarboxylate transport system substrate-binding protein
MARTFVGHPPLAFGVLVCALLVWAFVQVGPVGAAITLRAGASEPQGTTAPAMAIGTFCGLATKLSNGELNVQPFYQSLGVEQQLATAVKSGSVDIGYISTSNVARFTDAFLQFDLPFLFKNDRAYIEMLKSHAAGKKALVQFERDLGVKTLLITSHSYDAEVSGTDLQTRDRPVKVPADIKGLKLRSTSTPVELAVVKAYGANPTPVDWGQLYTALQQGVVDGNAGTPLPPYAAIKLYEVTKYYVAIGFRNNLFPIYMNQKKFDSLTPSQQKALLDAAAQTEALAGQYGRDKVKAAIEEVKKAGVQIYHPTRDEMAQWMSVREKVWQQVTDEFKGKIDLGVANDIFRVSAR